jgi:hypothetical protein
MDWRGHDDQFKKLTALMLRGREAAAHRNTNTFKQFMA